MARRAYGTGSIYQRSDGQWVAEWRERGQRRRVYGRTARAAADGMARARAEGIASERRRGTVGAELDRYLGDVRHTHAARTWERYEGLVRLHLAPALGRVRLDALTVDMVADVQSGLLKHGLSPRSVKLAMGLLRSVLGPGSVAHRVRPPRLPPARSRALTIDEAHRLIAACRTDRERLLVLLTLGLGLRLGEVCGLRWSDVYDGVLTVRHQLQRVPPSARGDAHLNLKPVKGGAPRMVPIMPPLKHLLGCPHQRLDEVPLVTGANGEHLNPRSAEYIIGRVALRTGITGLRFHDLRHSNATFLAALGVDAKTRMMLLGHRSVQVHADYTHPDEAMLREAVSRLGHALT